MQVIRKFMGRQSIFNSLPAFAGEKMH